MAVDGIVNTYTGGLCNTVYISDNGVFVDYVFYFNVSGVDNNGVPNAYNTQMEIAIFLQSCVEDPVAMSMINPSFPYLE